MKIETLRDGLIEIDGRIRIESGPVRRTAIATENLLSNGATASHYKAGAPDATGKLIEIDQPFTYVDWKSDETAWYVYRLETVTKKKGRTKEIFVLKGSHETQDAAMSAAVTLAADST